MCATRSDAITVKGIFRRHLRAFADRFLLCDFSIKSCPEAPCSLLVHFGPRSDAINGHKEELLRSYLAIEMLNVVEDLDEHLVLSHTKGGRVRFRMSAVMDDAIHIEVKTVEFGYPVLCNELRDGRISLAQPSEELWHTHDERVMSLLERKLCKTRQSCSRRTQATVVYLQIRFEEQGDEGDHHACSSLSH